MPLVPCYPCLFAATTTFNVLQVLLSLASLSHRFFETYLAGFVRSKMIAAATKIKAYDFANQVLKVSTFPPTN